MDEGVRNSDGTDAHRGTRFGGLGRLRVLSMMLETSSKEGWMLVWVGGQLLVLCCTACLLTCKLMQIRVEMHLLGEPSLRDVC